MNFQSILNKVLGKETKSVATSYNYKNFITERQMFRYHQDLRDYSQALAAAESIYSPNREQLYQMYANVILDPHLASQMATRKIKALGKNFKITRNGKEDEVATDLFKQKWFQDVLDYAQDAAYYGYSLINLGSIVDGTWVGTDLVPRSNVKPQTHLIVQNPGDTTGLDFTGPDLSPWMIGVGRERDLGILLQVAPLVLLKKAAISNWAEFNHMFGMPIRVGKTDLANEERAKAMRMMFEDMSSAAYAVMDKEDEITFAESVKSDGKVYENFLRWVDEQISKALIGQTMTADNGSSRSQAQVHERVSNDYVDYDLRKLTYAVNDQLIPLMIGQGFDLKNCSFAFFDEEDKTGLFDMTSKLIQGGYEVDEKWIEEKFGIPVKKAEPAPGTGADQPQDKEEAANFQKPAK